MNYTMPISSHLDSDGGPDDDDSQRSSLFPPLGSLDRGELPFLVTNWLANLNTNNSQATDRVHRAAAELAAAFSEAGLYGSAHQPTLGDSQPASNFGGGDVEARTRNATFADMKRRWGSTCPPDQLDRLLESTAATNRATNAAAVMAPNNLLLGNETHTQQTRNPTAGRTLQDAIDVEGESESGKSEETMRLTALQTPVLIATKPDAQPAGTAPQRPHDFQISVLSSFEVTAKHASSLIREYLDLREKCHQHEDQLRRIRKSLRLHTAKLDDHMRVTNTDSMNGANNNVGVPNIEPPGVSDEVDQDIQNCNRVIAQLNRQITSIHQQHANDKSVFQQVQEKALSAYRIFQSALSRYQDPFICSTGADKTLSVNRILHRVALRQSGLGAWGIGRYRASSGVLGCALLTRGVKRDFVCSHLSHGATINTHLCYSVYCLRFDRTGRYFVTGADDYLAKVYCLGEHVYPKRKTLDRESLIRGAVLVCTLRGHAGVINDINVSADNAFLATASEDGDCRVWGLKDGTPIAILRGHIGGANMVIWSELTPYRLVTAGSDGYARVWDIKEACIRRYKSVIGKREDYRSKKKLDSVIGGVVEERPMRSEDLNEGEPSVPLPAIPLPPSAPNEQRANAADAPVIPGPVDPEANATDQQQQQQQEGIVVPPLPEDDRPALGRFVSGDSIDSGVRLLSKLQHGVVRDDAQAVGTRSRRAAVKVLTVAFCPTGSHFTTGADDGICRVFSSVEDTDLEMDDSKRTIESGIIQKVTRPSRRTAASQLLLTLKGHLSAITDLQYSNAGDRIVSASQKDGVVRVWSFASDLDGLNTNSSLPSPIGGKNPNVSHVVIKLSNPNAPMASVNETTRRRPTRAVASKVSCDVATWTKDDSYIVTSQCEIAKVSTMEIVPGSQNIFVWDSWSGQCLMGINDAHSKQCTIVLPHPTDPSLIYSAGSEGQAKLWDLETGNCLFSHQNTVDFGPLNDARDRGRTSAFLDGSFAPDGMSVVLTDDSGRATVFCCTGTPNQSPQPEWTKEQYFGNDYYELLYDRDGYCIERGSEQPPHLAPQGVRCSHSGASAGEETNKAFKTLAGPLPLAEHDVQWERIKRRLKSENAGNRRIQRATIVGQFEPGTTILLNADGKSILAGTKTVQGSTMQTPVAAPTQDQQRSPQLSRNYRWRDYSDILNEEREEDILDSDDDSFQLETTGRTSGRRGSTRSNHEDSISDSDVDLNNDETANSPAGNRRGIARMRYIDGEDSSDEELFEYMSSNNTPSGPFVDDYGASSGHFWRLNHNVHVNRAWLRRNESASSYDGRKRYAPQLGDSVVYIPRAHHETINEFPSLEPPWQDWPVGAEWPVVRCLIRNIRYRFPYQSYFGRQTNSTQKQCKSIVAILTLELTGIPELSSEGALWPTPVFVSPTSRHVFEVGLFESDATDFIIPLDLYTARVAALDQSLVGLEVDAFFSSGDSSEEDQFLEPYKGVVEEVNDYSAINIPALSGSGFQALHVRWEDDGDADPFSTWELQVCNQAGKINPPQISDADKKKIRDAFREIKSISHVRDTFWKPVNTEQYYDYDARVEVAMTLSFATSRLENNYYSNKLSVVSDIKLIRDNCAKYNGENDDLTELANTMLKKFVELVLTEEERSEYQTFQEKLESGGGASNIEPMESSPSQAQSAPPENQGMVVRRSQRRRSRTSTSSEFERLFGESNSENASSRPRRVRLRMGNRRPRRDESSTSVLNQPAQPPLLSLESGTRGRRTRNSGQEGMPSRTLRSRAASSADAGVLVRNGDALRSAARQIDSGSNNSNSNVQNSREARAARRSANAAINEVSPQNDFEPNAEDEVDSRDLGSSNNEDSDFEAPNPSAPSSTASSRRRTSPRARSSARSSSREHEYSENNQDSDVEDSRPQRARRSSRRVSRGSRNGRPSDGSFDDGESNESDEDLDEGFEEENDRRSSRKRRRASRTTSSALASREVNDDSSEDFAQESEEEDEEHFSEDEVFAPRSSPRRQSKRSNPPAARRSNRSTRKSSLNDNDPSDLDEESLASNESIDSDDDAVSEAESEIRSPRRAARATISYHVPSSDEDIGSDGDKSFPQTKRRAPKSRSTKAVKKRKTNPAASSDFPEIKPWPDIEVEAITKVTQSILAALRERDIAEAFARPVVEDFPDLEESYSEKVSQPMDFRTIEEERLMSYRSIRELQEDLKLVFQNCIAYNPRKTNALNKLATEMLEGLEDTFRSVCKELDVLLKRGW